MKTATSVAKGCGWMALIALLLRCAVVPALSATAAGRLSEPRDVSSELEAVKQKFNVPGLVAIAMDGQEIVGRGAAGVRKKGAPELITIDDQFLICSGTKAMTATLVAMAIEEGKLSWTTTVREVFPEANAGWKEVTVAQLLQHRGGVPPDAAYIWTLLRVHFFSRAAPAEKREKLIHRVLARPPAYRPGARFVYSDIDYIMVALMLEKRSGHTWEELIREKLWTPLQMATGGCGSPGTSTKLDQPRGHWGSLFPGHAVEPEGVVGRLTATTFMGPAGTAHMTITDWAKFVGLHLRGDPGNPQQEPRLLTAASFAMLHHVAVQPERVTSGDPLFYESGWFLEKQGWAKGGRADDSGRVIRSLGDNGFWHIDAVVAPEIDLAVLVICNQGGVGQKPAALACEEVIRLLRAFVAEQRAAQAVNVRRPE